jgi:hypothetical protein
VYDKQANNHVSDSVRGRVGETVIAGLTDLGVSSSELLGNVNDGISVSGIPHSGQTTVGLLEQVQSMHCDVQDSGATELGQIRRQQHVFACASTAMAGSTEKRRL